MEVVHIPSGNVEINGVVYIAAGTGPHPTVVLCHGLPGNEKNLDLAQAMRRAGWTVITFNYRGSWGSPGNYRFAQNLEDASAVLAFARDPATAARPRIDPPRLVIMGHRTGGRATRPAPVAAPAAAQNAPPPAPLSPVKPARARQQPTPRGAQVPTPLNALSLSH